MRIPHLSGRSASIGGESAIGNGYRGPIPDEGGSGVRSHIQRTARLLMALGILSAAAVPSSGTTIFTTFGPGDSFNSGVAWIVGTYMGVGEGQEVAVSFTSGFDATLDSIRVATLYEDGPNNFTVYLASDNSGEPGAVIETFSGLVFTPEPGSILTLDSSLNPMLLSGSTYWIVMAAPDLLNSSGGWFNNDQGLTGALLRGTDGADVWFTPSPSNPAPAVEVNATAAIPEPATVGLTVTGLLTLSLLRRKRACRRNRARECLPLGPT